MPVLYLPKSRPTVPPVTELSWAHTDGVELPEGMCSVQLSPTWSPRIEESARRRSDLPDIMVSPHPARSWLSTGR